MPSDNCPSSVSPPKYGRPGCTSGVAMVASDVGEHAMLLTLLALWCHVGTAPESDQGVERTVAA